MKYYKIVVLMGHLGAGNSQAVPLFVKALNAYEAMIKAKKVPGVKHDKQPLSVVEITKEEFAKGREINEYGDFIANKNKGV